MTIKGITTVRNLVSGGVALIAAWSSYSHMVHLVLRYQERPEVAYALPFSVDGMLLVSTIVMADDKRHGRPVRPLARLSFVIGVAASVAANIAAAHPTLGARIIDAWPALALLLVVEMLARPPADAAATAEQATMSGPEHRDVPVVPIPSGNADVPPAKEVPARLGVPPDTELPPAATVPPVHATAYTAEAAPVTPLSAQPCLVPADSRHYQRHLQSVPYANDVRTAEATPAASARHDSAAFVPVDPQITVPPEHLVTGDAVVPAEQHGAAVRSDGLATDSLRSANTSAGKTAKVRRSATATRALAQSMMQAEPHLTKTEIAQRLEISTRRLRDVLAS